MRIIPQIIAQHAEETAFLWIIRDGAVTDPLYSLADLADLDGRLDAHLDGLRTAGEAGWEMCKEELSWGEEGEVFAASVLAFENGAESSIREIIDLLSGSPELTRSVTSALGWLPYHQALNIIERFLADQLPDLRRIGIAAAAIHRKDPGRHLTDALTADNPLLQARALKAAGELGRADLLPQLLGHLGSDDENCRFYAAWSAALLGVGARTVDILRKFAVSDFACREKALQLALRRMALPAANDWRKELARSEETIRLAIIGSGVIGDPMAIPWLIEQMRDTALARVAAESFSMITGLDLGEAQLEGEQPEGFESGPNDDPEDEDVKMDPEESLPWPDSEGVHDWWRGNQANFQPGMRYLMGQPMITAWLQVVLRRGYQRQRAAAALELASRLPGQPLFETRAPGFCQKQLLDV